MIEFKRLEPEVIIPRAQTEKAAGVDLHAFFRRNDRAIIEPGQTIKIHTGLAIHIKDPRLMGLIFARSGLSINRGIGLANAVAVIDADYQDEIIVALHNHGDEHVTIHEGDRIAQLVLVPVVKALFIEVDEFSETEARSGGLGSTGV